MDSFPETYNDPSWIVSRTLKDWNSLSYDIIKIITAGQVKNIFLDPWFTFSPMSCISFVEFLLR